jgi:hypothetical protein
MATKCTPLAQTWYSLFDCCASAGCAPIDTSRALPSTACIAALTRSLLGFGRMTANHDDWPSDRDAVQ